MFICEVCGKKVFKKIRLHGYTLCHKHMHQLHTHGKFLDNCPRTINDLNEYRVENGVAYFDLYNSTTSEKVDEFMIDADDIPLVKFHRWRFSHSHIVTGSKTKGGVIDVSWIITGLTREQLDDGYVVDHINGNAKDNRKQNLRICTQPENVLNKSFMSTNTSGFIGVAYKKERNTWDPEIRRNNIRCHLGATRTIEEAVYKRLIATKLIFGEYGNEQEILKAEQFTQNLSAETKAELETITKNKLIAKGLWQ